MKTGNQTIYEYHNINRRGDGYSLLKKERGTLFAKTIGTGKKILDLGCRDGALTQFFINGNDVLGADIDTLALGKAAKLGIKILHLDINNTWKELEGQKFDVVVLAETLEHLYYPDNVMNKITSVLNDDGVLIGSVPNAFNLKNRIRLFFGKKRYTPLQDPTHINHFIYSELKDLLQKHFKDVKIIPLGKYASWDKIMPGMFSFDLVFICKK